MDARSTYLRDYADRFAAESTLPKTDAEDVYVLNWPLEERKFWKPTLKAAERYHGNSVYPDNWNDAKSTKPTPDRPAAEIEKE